MTEKEIFNAVFGEPNYDHIARDSEIKLSLSADETKVIYKTFDRGLLSLSTEQAALLEAVIAKIKAELHP